MHSERASHAARNRITAARTYLQDVGNEQDENGHGRRHRHHAAEHGALALDGGAAVEKELRPQQVRVRAATTGNSAAGVMRDGSGPG
jgi:hypothetical protein